MNSPRQRLCFKSVAVKSSGNTSTLNVFWVMLQLLLFSVEGRQTPPVRIKARSGVHGSKEIYKNLSNRDPGPGMNRSSATLNQNFGPFTKFL